MGIGRESCMSFDTTASNSRKKNSPCILTEAKLEKSLLYFACSHHILELVFGVVFLTLMGPSQGADILLFKRFRYKRESLDKTKFQTGDVNDKVSLSFKRLQI